MQRFLIALFISLGFLGIAQESKAQYIVDISGYLLPSQTRIFYARTPNNTQTDTIYRISGYYNISGTLIIQPGAEVHFLPDSRILDSTGGSIIANGFDRSSVNPVTGAAVLPNRIQMRGININSNSYEWGHILVLPNAFAYFANVRFAFFRKKESIDNVLIYGNTTGAPLTNSLAIIQASNGTGGVMTTFSANTWLYDVIVDSCQAIYKGGAFAFLQAPLASYFPGDDGRLALAKHQVRRLLIRDTRVFNETGTPNSHQFWPDTGAYGGAIYMSARNGATISNFSSDFLGYANDAATPIAGSFISNIALNSGGINYTSSPTVTISGGGGTGAIATATISQNGNVTGITIVSSGVGFTSVPSITISGGGGSGASATASIIAVPLAQSLDTMHFERCVASNPAISSGTVAAPVYQQAYGGAIYVGNYCALTTALIGCYSDSAIAKSGDLNMRGGAIYVSKFSADPSWLPPPALTSKNSGLSVLHRGSFVGNVAGQGGAIYGDWQDNGSLLTNGPSLNIDGDYGTNDFTFRSGGLVYRDSGVIQFLSNTAYNAGGAIYENWYTYITGYLSPNTTFPMRWDSVEMRVRFFNNCAGVAGGAICLNPDANPDYQIRRAWEKDNFVNPLDPRISRPNYELTVLGGGAEFLGSRDSTFAVEYHSNYVVGGNGGAVYWNMQQSGPVGFADNKFMVENSYNALNPSNSNGVSFVTVTNGGTLYTTPPTITLVGGGGIGATAVAVINGGSVIAINITSPGLFYTSNPTVVISGGGGVNAAATATIMNIQPQPIFDPRELTRFCDNMASLGSASDSSATDRTRSCARLTGCLPARCLSLPPPRVSCRRSGNPRDGPR